MATSLITLCIQILFSLCSSAFKLFNSFLLCCPVSYISFAVIPHISYAVSAPTITLLLGCSCWVFLSCRSPLWSPSLSTITFSALSFTRSFFLPSSVSFALSEVSSFISVIQSAPHLEKPSQFSLLQSLLKEQAQKTIFCALLLCPHLPPKTGCSPSPCTLVLSRERSSLLPLTDLTDAHLSWPRLSHLPASRGRSHGFTGVNCLDVYEKVLVTINDLCSLLNSRRLFFFNLCQFFSWYKINRATRKTTLRSHQKTDAYFKTCFPGTGVVCCKLTQHEKAFYVSLENSYYVFP